MSKSDYKRTTIFHRLTTLIVHLSIPIVFMLTCSTAVGQEEIQFMLTSSTATVQAVNTPQFGIKGASNEYQVGDLIELSIEETIDKEDIISADYVWTILPSNNHKLWPDKSKILFGTGPVDTQFIVILNASYVFGQQDPAGKIENIQQRSDSVVAQIKVGQPTVPATPNIPTPTTPNNPIIPNNPTIPESTPVTPELPNNDELTGSSAMAYEWVRLVKAVKGYEADQIKQDAINLADSFESIASLIDEGQLTEISEIFAAAKESNDRQVTNRDAWLPWFLAASSYLQSNYKSGTISTAEDFSATWKDFATGLTTAASSL